MSADKSQPTAAFDVREHNFGIIDASKGVVSTTFNFTNTGNAPLVIISAKANCGCTVPKYPVEPIAPGKSGQITVRYNPSGNSGAFTKYVRVQTNDPHNRKINLKIKGSVKPDKQ